MAGYASSPRTSSGETPPAPATNADTIAAKPKLLDQVRNKCRLQHKSIRTEQAYVDWIRRFILFHNKRHPRDMGAAEIEAFLTHPAVAGKVAAVARISHDVVVYWCDKR